MRYEEAKKKFLKNVAEAKYQYTSDLLNLVDDDNVIALYTNYNKIFSTLSGMSKELILNNTGLLDASIEVLEAYFDKYISEEDFNEMDRDEQVQLVVDVLENCDDLYSLFMSLI